MISKGRQSHMVKLSNQNNTWMSNIHLKSEFLVPSHHQIIHTSPGKKKLPWVDGMNFCFGHPVSLRGWHLCILPFWPTTQRPRARGSAGSAVISWWCGMGNCGTLLPHWFLRKSRMTQHPIKPKRWWQDFSSTDRTPVLGTMCPLLARKYRMRRTMNASLP